MLELPGSSRGYTAGVHIEKLHVTLHTRLIRGRHQAANQLLISRNEAAIDFISPSPHAINTGWRETTGSCVVDMAPSDTDSRSSTNLHRDTTVVKLFRIHIIQFQRSMAPSVNILDRSTAQVPVATVLKAQNAAKAKLTSG